MPRKNNSLRSQIHTLRRSQRLSLQSEDIKRYFGVREKIATFFRDCLAACSDCSRDVSRFSLDKIPNLDRAADHEQSLLELVPVERRERLKTQAARAAAEGSQQLGAIEPTAHAELRLRYLVAHCVENLSYKWPKRSRLPAWEQIIQVAQIEFQGSVNEWSNLRKKLERVTR